MVVMNLIGFQKKHGESNGFLLELRSIYSITMGDFFSVVLAVKWEQQLTCLHKNLLEQWLKKKHQALLLLTDMLMEVWPIFQGPGPSLRPNPSSIKIKKKFLWLVCQLELLLEQTAHFQTMSVMVEKFWQALSIPEHCLLHYSCL